MLTILLIAFCLSSLSCVSCAPQGNREPDIQALAKQKADNDALVAQIPPAEVPVGGSIVVIIPTDESLIKTTLKLPPGYKHKDFVLQWYKNKLLTMVDAVRRRHSFDTIQCCQSVGPEQEHFEEDFALICPIKFNPEWLLKARAQAGYDPVPVEFGAPPLSRFQCNHQTHPLALAPQLHQSHHS